jgi:large subunit ribosomal protein L20
MPRVKDAPASRRRRKKILDRASGYWGGKHRLLRSAAEAVNRAGVYAYRDRRQRRRDFRSLWIIRVNAAAREEGLSYSRFMAGLRKAGVAIDRKMLADMAVHDREGFRRLADVARAA